MSKDLQDKAEAGDQEAQCQMALLYEIGLDRPLDYEQAYSWWRKAADQGSGWALQKISELIKAGHIEDESKSAEEWEDLAEEAGYQTANKIIAASKKKKPKLHPHALGKKVLAVDDELGLREMISGVLEIAGLNTITAEDGKQALKALGEHPDIDLIFLDLQMPNMNGFQFLETIRKLKAAEGTPIVILTAFTKPEYVAKGKKLGVNAWIMKPFKVEKIMEITNELLQLEKQAS